MELMYNLGSKYNKINRSNSKSGYYFADYAELFKELSAL